MFQKLIFLIWALSLPLLGQAEVKPESMPSSVILPAEANPHWVWVNDIVFHDDTTTDATAITMHKVITVSSTYPGAVDLSDGTVVGSASDSD